MVLGLIDFLLGGKKKTKVPRTGQVVAPLNSVRGDNSQPAQPAGSGEVPDGTQKPTENVVSNQNMKFEDSNNNGQAQPVQPQMNSNPVGGKKISEVISKIHDEIKSTNEKVSEMVGDIKNIENNVNTLTHRVDELDENKKITDEKLANVDSSMTKFLSLYELINNQYNPFVEQGAEAPKQVVLSDGNSESEEKTEVYSEPKSFDHLNLVGTQKSTGNTLESSLLELHTLDIEEAAADAVPLTKLKNNTNSLVIILSWLEYLIKRVGIEEARNSLRYYTETLRWTTPEVFFDLDKYLKGMKDNKNITGDESLTVRDHIVSLYFISKLNEKALDKKLTAAVLQIIKE